MSAKKLNKLAIESDDLKDGLQQLSSRLARIEHKVDSLEQTNSFSVRADPDRHIALVKKIFGKSARRAKVYLAINGQRSVKAIAEHLGLQRQDVGKEISVLREEDLVDLADSYSNLDIYAKNPLEKSIRISSYLTNEFSLASDGRPATGKSK